MPGSTASENVETSHFTIFFYQWITIFFYQWNMQTSYMQTTDEKSSKKPTDKIL
jgi:hypothetical protein